MVARLIDVNIDKKVPLLREPPLKLRVFRVSGEGRLKCPMLKERADAAIISIVAFFWGRGDNRELGLTEVDHSAGRRELLSANTLDGLHESRISPRRAGRIVVDVKARRKTLDHSAEPPDMVRIWVCRDHNIETFELDRL